MDFKRLSHSIAAVVAASSLALPAGAAQLEEIVVTARKKAESMQDSPVAVSAVNRETIQAAFLGDATGIAQFAPNVVFDDISAGTPGGGGISIRGISYQDVEKTFDPAVLMYLDGVPLGTNTGNAMNLLDVERIEVLRGPQGTLFGKNAVGGVINIHRTKPIIGQWAGKARVRVESEDSATNLEGVLNIPLGDTLAAKVNVARLEEPGYYDNITNGDDEGESDEERFGIHFLWQPTDDLTAEFQYNQSEMDGILAPMLNINSPLADLCAGFGACAASDDEPLSGDRREGAGNLGQDFFLDSKDYQVDLNWDISPSLTGVLIAAHRETDERTFIDFDGSPQTLFHIRRTSEYEQDSLELRLDYTADRLSVTGGYFYWNGEVSGWENEATIPLFLGLPVGTCGFDTVACQFETASAESKSHSVFFEGDYRFAENWYFVLGARYIEEDKELTKTSQVPIAGLTTLPTTTGDRTDDDIIHRIGFRWEPTPNVMAYATWSTGFRSGGFSIRGVTPEIIQTGFEPETVDNYELGIKTELFDRRVRLNATVFRMEYDDMQIELQVPRPGPGSGTQDSVVNAGSATIDGVELEVTALLNDYFTLDFNAGWLDAGYDTFRGQIFADGTQNDDNSNLPLRRAPEWNYTAALNYSQAVGGGDLRGRLSYSWTDDYAGTVTDFPGTHVDDFGLLDASLNYTYGQWQVGVFGRNLTDEDEYSHTFAVVPYRSGRSLFTFATPRAPRTYGLELTYTFGDY
jgi:iron complex outermembrane receptor protein